MINPPRSAQSVPENADKPGWESAKYGVVAMVQLMDDLGRQQWVELDFLRKRNGDEIEIGFFSWDRVANKWPVEYIQDVQRELQVELPVFSLSIEAMRKALQGYDPTRIRIFPHIIILDNDRSILSILRGVRTAQEIEAEIERFEAGTVAPPRIVEQPPTDTGIANGDFEDWANSSAAPTGWLLSDASAQAVIRWEEPTSKNLALEIRSATSRNYHFVFQILSETTSLYGKKLRLSASARSNSLGKPVVALTVTHPLLEKGYRFVPESPIQDPSGNRIPFRILGALDFEKDHSRWQALETVVEMPSDPKLARAFALMIYLDNPKAAGGAALFDNVRLDWAQ